MTPDEKEDRSLGVDDLIIAQRQLEKYERRMKTFLALYEDLKLAEREYERLEYENL